MNKLFIFAAGATIGSVVTWKFLKTKYERIAQEEIESVKEVFSRKEETFDTDSTDEDIYEDTSEDLNEMNNILQDSNYTAKNEEEGETETVKDREYGHPYVIKPEEFGEKYNYETVSLTYYADGVLADDFDEVIEAGEIDDMVGLDSLETFGEYEDDSVFVRNDEMETDFEILLDERNFYDLEG